MSQETTEAQVDSTFVQLLFNNYESVQTIETAVEDSFETNEDQSFVGFKALFISQNGQIVDSFNPNVLRRSIDHYLANTKQAFLKQRQIIIAGYRQIYLERKPSVLLRDDRWRKLNDFLIHYMIYYDWLHPLPDENGQDMRFSTVVDENDGSGIYQVYQERSDVPPMLYHWAVSDLHHTLSLNSDFSISYATSRFLGTIEAERERTKTQSDYPFKDYAQLINEANTLLKSHLEGNQEPSLQAARQQFKNSLEKAPGTPSTRKKILGMGLVVLGASLFVSSAFLMGSTFFFGTPVSILGFVLSAKIVAVGIGMTAFGAMGSGFFAKRCFEQATSRGVHKAGMTIVEQSNFIVSDWAVQP